MILQHYYVLNCASASITSEGYSGTVAAQFYKGDFFPLYLQIVSTEGPMLPPALGGNQFPITDHKHHLLSINYLQHNQLKLSKTTKNT